MTISKQCGKTQKQKKRRGKKRKQASTSTQQPVTLIQCIYSEKIGANNKRLEMQEKTKGGNANRHRVSKVNDKENIINKEREKTEGKGRLEGGQKHRREKAGQIEERTLEDKKKNKER